MTRDLIKKSALLFAIAATTAAAPSAFAASNMMTEKKLTVKISMSELSDTAGVERAYEKLQEKASTFCKNESFTLYYLNETVEECVEDLMEQFISTSNVAPLKAHHEKVAEMTAPKTFAIK